MRQLKSDRKRFMREIEMRTGIKLTEKEFDIYLEQQGRAAQQTRLEVIRKTAKVEIVDPDLETTSEEGFINVDINKYTDQKVGPGDTVIVNGVPLKITGVKE